GNSHKPGTWGIYCDLKEYLIINNSRTKEKAIYMMRCIWEICGGHYKDSTKVVRFVPTQRINLYAETQRIYDEYDNRMVMIGAKRGFYE
ncbi:7052_t:CDS:2, partial [Racocetra persica]